MTYAVVAIFVELSNTDIACVIIGVVVFVKLHIPSNAILAPDNPIPKLSAPCKIHVSPIIIEKLVVATPDASFDEKLKRVLLPTPRNTVNPPLVL